MKYEMLLDEAYADGLIVKELPLKYNDGRIEQNRIAIRKSIETTSKKVCVLAEELGHYYTSSGDILDQSDIANQKQERKARGWAYNKTVPLEKIKQAYHAGYTEPWEIAEYLDIDEEFLREAIQYYEQKYGYELLRERQEAEFLESLKVAGIEFDE